MNSSERTYAFEKTCPTCRVTFPSRSIVCPKCGGIPDFDAARMAAMETIDRLLRRVFRARGDQRAISRIGLMWVLALVPVLVGPPMIALVLAVFVLRDGGASRSERNQVFAIALVCVANFAISLWLDYLLAAEIIRFGISLKHAFEDWLQSVLTIRIAPGPGMPGGHSFRPRSGTPI